MTGRTVPGPGIHTHTSSPVSLHPHTLPYVFLLSYIRVCPAPLTVGHPFEDTHPRTSRALSAQPLSTAPRVRTTPIRTQAEGHNTQSVSYYSVLALSISPAIILMDSGRNTTHRRRLELSRASAKKSATNTERVHCSSLEDRALGVREKGRAPMKGVCTQPIQKGVKRRSEIEKI